jgi:hypothetical protein
LRAIQATNPLSRSKKVELDAMAAWASQNAVNASRSTLKVGATAYTPGRQLEL